MIHDLLLALLGFTGDLVQFDPDENRLILADLARLEKFDQAIVSEILRVGSLYVRLRSWADKSPPGSSNIYMQAAAKVVGEVILRDFENAVADYESTLLESMDVLSSGLSLSHMKLRLTDEWADALDLVSSWVVCPGECPLESLVSLEQSKHAILLPIRASLFGVLVRQLVSWCKLGLLVGEGFFIFQTELQISSSPEAKLASFQIHTHLVPRSLISADLAAKILFCGRAASVIQLGGEHSVRVPGFSMDRIPTTTGALADYLESEVNQIRAHLAKRLNVLVQGTLLEELRRLRGLYLLGYGDCWSDFLAEYIHMQRWELEDAAAVEKKFRRSFPSVSAISVSVELGTMQLSVQYSPPWPIQLVVTADQVKKFQEIFRFLFRLRFFHAQLVTVSVHNNLKHNLVHFFHSLFSFIQLDLIEAEWRQFLSIVHISEDVQEVAREHDLLVSKLHTGCFLPAVSVMASIGKLEDIAKMVLALSSQIIGDERTSEIGKLENEFMSAMGKLLYDLDHLQVTSTYASVNRLISKLDYNSFYRSSTN